MDALHIALIGPLIGGLGLFLLGMGMMTDGLRMAAGPALKHILAAATRTRWHALGSGFLVTAMVQSSSAITVATIGFINAGLLSLAPALWVLFGANVGSTITGWLVALVGLKFKIEALALPLVGVGVLFRLAGPARRSAGMGTAVAGLGLLFLGLGWLQQSFVGMSATLSLPQGDGPWVVLAQVAVGLFMTVLMQSSSASIAIALTAAQGGLLGAHGAAAVVIGANVGTTVTALLAAIGATPNARRAAMAHVIFNLITGCVALLMLPWLIGALSALEAILGLASEPALQLALFHTVFNLLGVILMWPLASSLTRWLQRRFRAREEDQAQAQFLDDNVLAVPTLALDALEREIARVGHLVLRMARAALAGADAPRLADDREVARRLDQAIEVFVERMNRAAMPRRTSERLAWALRVLRYHETTSEQAFAASQLAGLAASAGGALVAAQARFAQLADELLVLCDPLQGELPGAGLVAAALDAAEKAYQKLKATLLAAGADGQLPMAGMEEALRRYSALRRATQQAAKATRREDASQAEPDAAAS